MADWRDGAEYAPDIPPVGFAAPTVPPLGATSGHDGPPRPGGSGRPSLPAAPGQPLIPGGPGQPLIPGGPGQTLLPGTPGQTPPPPPPDAIVPPTQPGPALSQVAPTRQPQRDPRVPFPVGAASFGVSAGARNPRQPFEVSRPEPVEMAEFDLPTSTGEPSLNFPPPTGVPVAPPAPPYPPAAGPTPPTSGPWPGQPEPGMPLIGPQPWNTPPAPSSEGIGLGEVLRRVGWPLLGCLVAGVALRPLALPALLAAWMFSMGVRVGGLGVRRAFGAAIGVVSLVLVVAIMLQYFDPLDAANTAARWACGLLLFICPLLVWRASQNTR